MLLHGRSIGVVIASAARAAVLPVIVTLLVVCGPPVKAHALQVPPLRPGVLVDDTLPEGGTRAYQLAEAVGTRLALTLVGSTTNLNLQVVDAAGTLINEAWVPRGSSAVVRFFVEEPAPFTVRVRSLAAELPDFADEFPAGRFQLRLERTAEAEAREEMQELREVVGWLSASVRPLASVDAGTGFADLAHLREVLEGVRIVGLGEATHGTREFFQIKHRLIEYLVSELGFTVVGLEMDAGAARALDEYIAGGDGDLATVVASQGMWQWNTDEVAALVAWLRAWNSTAPEQRRVRLIGFDFQVNDRGRADVLQFLSRVAPDRVASTDSLLVPLVRRPDPDQPRAVAYYTYTPDRRAAMVAGVNELLGFMVLNEALFTRAASAAEYRLALDATRRFAQFVHSHRQETYATDSIDSGVAIRSRYMAENIARELEAADAGTRMVVWAHNLHVTRDPYTTGYFLSERFGSQYYAAGLAFDRGGFRALQLSPAHAPRMTDTSVGPALQESVGWYLTRSGSGSGFVDFRRAPQTGPVARWLAHPRAMRSVGNGYSFNRNGYLARDVMPGRAFDGLIFIEQTTPARPNREIRE